jgi:protein-S-isoprenylcysteine O-methyltransferase Ste14
LSETAAATFWVIGIVIWAAYRWPYQRRARRRRLVRSEYDLEERALIGGAVVGLFLIPLFYLITGFPELSDYPFRSGMGWAGCAVMVLFLVVFIRSHRDLGRNFSVTLEIREKHTLVTDGIYRHLRHPMYASFWLWALAQALLFPNWIVGSTGILSVAILYLRRMPREERMMLDTFGESYRAYSSRTYRLIPFIY